MVRTTIPTATVTRTAACPTTRARAWSRSSSSSRHVEPDLVIAPKGTFDDQEEWHDPSAVLLVAEITSKSTADRDRHKKIHGYARVGIPISLLIDAEEAEVTVYSDPSGDDYAKSARYKLGLTVPLPDPLGFELDTAEF
jgi:Uma2 family endonuclease